MRIKFLYCTLQIENSAILPLNLTLTVCTPLVQQLNLLAFYRANRIQISFIYTHTYSTSILAYKRLI